MKVFGELEINTVQFYDLENALGKAKQIEKEQIINGWDNGFLDYQISMHEDAEQYYKETFGDTK
jgi:hypothetical protein